MGINHPYVLLHTGTVQTMHMRIATALEMPQLLYVANDIGNNIQQACHLMIAAFTYTKKHFASA